MTSSPSIYHVARRSAAPIALLLLAAAVAGQTKGSPARFTALAVNMGSPGSRCVQPKSSQKTKTIKRLCGFCQLSHALVVHLLIQIQPGLMPAEHIHLELNPSELN